MTVCFIFNIYNFYCFKIQKKKIKEKIFFVKIEFACENKNGM